MKTSTYCAMTQTTTLTKRLPVRSLLAGLIVTAFVTSPAEAQTVAGYLYTSLNGEGINQVVAIERHQDGTLGEQIAYSTESKGGANRAVGGDAAGDFDSQGAIQIIDDYMLVVNAGGNTVSVFKVDRRTGNLTRKENVDSIGARPVSITYVRKPQSTSDYWVIVGNQWNNPNVQKGGDGEGQLEMYPDGQFHANGGGHESVLKERNIYLYSFNSTNGELVAVKSLDNYSGTNGGPATVALNEDGSKLAVSTWGIAHFGTANPTHQKPSRVYVYDFDTKTGDIANRRHFEEAGIAGSIGFSWAKGASNLFVSNFNLTPDKRDHSLTVLRDTGNLVVKVANFGTGNGADIDEACWTALNPSGDKLYVSSFGGNLISAFDVTPDGMVRQIGDGSETVYASRAANIPAGDTKDMVITADGKHLYSLGAFQTFGIASFSIDERGTLSYRAETKVTAATQTGPGAYNFLGLVGFDKP